MTTQNGRAFNEWLRAQLKAKKMSQRQLAQQSGVDHSTISRLIRGDRMPSLGTATKLARGLREIRDDSDAPVYLGLVNSGPQNPTARVEYALRADELLTEPQVRQIMEYYLAVRMRRFGRAFQSTADGGSGTDPRGGPGNGGLGQPHGRTSAGPAPTPGYTTGRYTALRPINQPPRPVPPVVRPAPSTRSSQPGHRPLGQRPPARTPNR